MAYRKRRGMFAREEFVKQGAYSDCVTALVAACSSQRDRHAMWHGPQSTQTLDAVRALAQGHPRNSETNGYGYVWAVRRV